MNSKLDATLDLEHLLERLYLCVVCVSAEALELISTAANHSNAAIRKMVRPAILSLLWCRITSVTGLRWLHDTLLRNCCEASEWQQTGSGCFLPRVS